MQHTYRFIYTLCMCLELLLVHVEGDSFIASFQDDIEGSHAATSKSWLEFPSKLTSAREFTSCHWLKMKYFNLKTSGCLWSYCVQEKENAKMICLQTCLQGIYDVANRNLKFQGELVLHSFEGAQLISQPLASSIHRSWIHLCWSFSTISGESKIYQGGKLLGSDTLAVTKSDWAIRGSERVHATAFIFGQEPDMLGGGFDKNEAFVGQLSEFQLWNYTLDSSDILEMAQCLKLRQGNVFSWNKSNVVTNNVKISHLANPSMFCEKHHQYIMFPHKMSYPKAKDACEVHGGSLVVPRSSNETRILLDIVSQHKETCLPSEDEENEGQIWIGAKKVDHVWYRVSSISDHGYRLKYTKISRVSSASDTPCAYLQYDGTWVEGQMFSCTLVYLCAICEIHTTPVFTIKSFCRQGEMDWNYYIRLGSNLDVVSYEGYKRSDIVFDKTNKRWQILSKKGFPQRYIAELSTNNFTAHHPFGRKLWFVKDPICQINDANYETTISVCNFPFQFTCNSGQCVDINKRCDEQSDCVDDSDEERCELILDTPSYNRANAPTGLGRNMSLQINMQTNIISIDSIDTVEMRIVLTLEQKMTWYDERLTFSNPNLRKDNLISRAQGNLIWRPTRDLIYENAIIGEIEYAPYRVIRIIPVISENMDASKSIENRLFNGTKNPLEMTVRMRIKYNCIFDAKQFPFDTQSCSLVTKMMRLSDKPLSFIADENVVYKGLPTVGQFRIGRMIVNVKNTNQSTNYIVIIHMTRDFTNQLLVTFIPTAILWLFGYSTLLIEPNEDGFGHRFMGTGTALLALVTLMNAVSDDLPKTSYMKYIDLWFAWHVFCIFVMIIYHVILDRIRGYVESQNKDRVISFELVDGINGHASGFGKRIVVGINNVLIVMFPAINGLLYAIYFNLTIN